MKWMLRIPLYLQLQREKGVCEIDVQWYSSHNKFCDARLLYSEIRFKEAIFFCVNCGKFLKKGNLSNIQLFVLALYNYLHRRMSSYIIFKFTTFSSIYVFSERCFLWPTLLNIVYLTPNLMRGGEFYILISTSIWKRCSQMSGCLWKH